MMMLMFVFVGHFGGLSDLIVFVFFFSLHAFDDFFCFYTVAKNIHQIDFNTALLWRGCEGVFNPFVGFSAYVNHHVGACDFCDIVSRGLVTVQIDSVFHEKF